MSDRIDEITEVEKGIDHIEEVEKFNPFHDALGRFSNSNGMRSYSANPKTKAGAMAIQRSTAAGYGAVMNVHRESKGENIRQNDNWLKSGQKPTPSQLSRASANAPKTVAQARQNAHTNRVKGTMGATESASAKHPSKPKTQQQQKPQKQTPQQNQQQNQQQQAQNTTQAPPKTGTVNVKQKMQSGVTMDVDFDQSTVAGARNKEFRGTAEGRDLTKSFDGRKTTATDSYWGDDRYTNQVADLQGFNSPMKRVSKTELDNLARKNGDLFMREVGSTPDLNGRPATAKQMKQAYSTENDMKMNGGGGRVYGDGIYVASGSMKVHNSGGSYKSHMDSNVQQSIRREVQGYGDGHTVLKMAWLKKPNIVNQSQIESEFNKLSRSEQQKYGDHVNTYACAKGYDAMRASTECYMVIFNRSKVAVLDD